METHSSKELSDLVKEYQTLDKEQCSFKEAITGYYVLVTTGVVLDYLATFSLGDAVKNVAVFSLFGGALEIYNRYLQNKRQEIQNSISEKDREF